MAEVSRQLGRYELLEKIAAGGMGEIFLAKMRGAAGFERQVIIKTILPHLAEQDEFVSKFLNEAHTVVQLVHGNIVPVFDMGEQNGEYFIAMEYVPGRDLRAVIKQLALMQETCPVNIALHLISEVCKGLGYAHRKLDATGKPLQLVHRDVSPSNVLVSNEGEVRLIDFGIAHVADGLTRSVSGRIQGKFCYMSPEQASGKRLDARSDIFSTGVMLYEMLTGVRPFHGANDMETLELVRAAVYDPPSTLIPTIPQDVDDILARAMAKDREDRYPDASAMLAEVMQYLYMHEEGGAPSSQDVVEWLEQVFPGGLASREKQPQSLDDILAAQLQELSSGESSLAYEETSSAASLSLPSPALARGTQHTATLVTHSDSHSPVLVDLPGQLDRPGSDTPQQQPNTPPAVQEYLAAAPEGQDTPTPLQEAPSGRGMAIVLALGLLSLACGVVWVSLPSQGAVSVASMPAGAQVQVDGVWLEGAVTPLELELKGGQHVFRVRQQGLVPPTPQQVEVKPGGTHTVTFVLSSPEPKSTPTATPQPPAPSHMLALQSTPSGAQVVMDGKPVGQTPLSVELPGGRETVVFDFRHPRCKPYNRMVSTRHDQDTLAVELECESEPVALPQPTSGQGRVAQAPKPERLRVSVTPAEASVVVDGEAVQGGMTLRAYGKDDRVSVLAQAPGYVSFEEKVRVGSLRQGELVVSLRAETLGCLDIRVMEPALGMIFIDGESIGQVKFAKKGHKLAAGVHSVRAQNEAAGREETKRVEVAGGGGCANVVFFEPER